MRWIGWRGGAQLLKRETLTDLSPHAVTELVRAREKEVIVGNGMDLNEAERGRVRQGIPMKHEAVDSGAVVAGGTINPT